MRRDVALAGLGFWLLVSALMALMGGRARADAPAAAPVGAPVAARADAPAAAPVGAPVAARADAPVAAPAGAPVAARADAPVAAPAGAPVAAQVDVPVAAPAGAPVVAHIDVPVAAPAAAVAPVAAVTWGQFHGQVVFSDIMIASPAQFPSDAAMSEALRRLKRTTVEGADGFWRLHLVAFLEPAPRVASFRLRATDVTDPKDRHEVKMFEVDGKPGQTELEINDLVVTEVMGFERGHRYEIAVIARGDDLPAGKPDVCAKGVITLM
jgi:hypothetical protein